MSKYILLLKISKLHPTESELRRSFIQIADPVQPVEIMHRLVNSPAPAPAPNFSLYDVAHFGPIRRRNQEIGIGLRCFFQHSQNLLVAGLRE